MMIPIVLAVIDVALRSRVVKGLSELGGIPEDNRDVRNFALSALLGAAYRRRSAASATSSVLRPTASWCVS